MTDSIAIYTPVCPYPATFGFLSRVLSMAHGFKDLGYKVHLLGTEFITNPWPTESISYLEHHLVSSVRIYKISTSDYRIRKLLKRIYTKLGYDHPPMFSTYYTPPGARLWFSHEVVNIHPKAVMINYARYDSLLNHNKFRLTRRILDTIDLESLNLSMQKYIRKLLPPEPVHPDRVDGSILKEDFFQHARVQMDQREYHVYDKYTNTIAIAQSEADLIQKNTKIAQVNFIPMMYNPIEVSNSYTGQALFPTGPNPFNVQGYAYFAKKVLPHVLRNCPDFHLQITGSLTDARVISVPGVELLGFVPDLIPYYSQCKFVISPVFGGTGQQIKIIEAMAHGLPVIALKDAASRSPLQHGINGLVANNEMEFAEHVCRLWTDQELCRKLGKSARYVIQEKYSQGRLNSELSRLLSS